MKITRNKTATKDKLLNAAVRLFSLNGYAGISVDEIVAKAGVNKRMVYHYFGSKEDLYQAALSEVYGRLTRLELATIHLDSPVEEAIEALVKAYFGFLATNPEFVQLILWENIGRGKHLGAATVSLAKAPILQILHKVMQRGIREGKIHSHLKTKHLLINLIGLCFVYFSNRYTLSRAVGMDLQSPKVLRAGVAQVVWLLKHGTAPQQSARKR